MRDAFIRGIGDSGNEYILSDLYKMDFDPTMTEQEYLRDAHYRDTPDVADDILAEQEKINSADAIAFIYLCLKPETGICKTKSCWFPVPRDHQKRGIVPEG